MAKTSKAIPENVDGNFYVDDSCINCGVSRHYAPDIFGDTGIYAYVKKQPENKREETDTKRAIIACPTASIGMRERENLNPVRDEFPLKMIENVYINGFNHKDSFGAHSYFIKSEAGNWMIDSPRYVSHLVRKFEELGGIQYIFLTHRDDVCDAHLYAEHFGAKRIIHKFESGAQKDAEIILEGEDSYQFDLGHVYFTPGHTRGHMVLLWNNQYLFTGDHFAYIPERNHFSSFRSACWYSWDKQIESVHRMMEFKDVEWVFPGHGKWGQIEKGKFPEIITTAVQWMKSVQ